MMNKNKPVHYTVLVVDDDEAQCSLAAQVLQSDPQLKILVSTDGHDALKKAEMYEPDIIISDYYMPRMDGAELCRRIKQHPILRERMFIMLTSATAVTEKVKLLESGADELLTKPIHPDELISRVKASIRIVSLQQELKAGQKKLAETNAELTESYEGVLDLLAILVGVHVPDAAKRAEEAKKIVQWFSKKLQMTEDEEAPIVSAAALHEIGKVNVPIEILRSEEKNFRESERAHYSVAGYLLLARIPNLADVAHLVRHQLENYDGSGFPDRLVQEEIPIGARILRAINYLEQVRTETDDPQKVMESLRKVQGTLIDPMISQLLDEYLLVTGSKNFMDGKRAVSVLELIPGMILASDINTGSGTKLLPKETMMTASLVERIHNHNQIDPIIGTIFIHQ